MLVEPNLVERAFPWPKEARPQALGTLMERCLASAFAKPTARQVRGRKGAKRWKDL